MSALALMHIPAEEEIKAELDKKIRHEEYLKLKEKEALPGSHTGSASSQESAQPGQGEAGQGK